MFIKRLNKIYAPPAAKQPASIESSTKPLKVSMMCLDPHCNLLSLYSELSDTIYLVSVLSVLEYMDEYRREFCNSGGLHYSLKTGLVPQLMIHNPKPSLHIFDIAFSHSLQNTQFLVVAYFNGVLDVYSVNSGKKIDSVDITLKNYEEKSPIENKTSDNKNKVIVVQS